MAFNPEYLKHASSLGRFWANDFARKIPASGIFPVHFRVRDPSSASGRTPFKVEYPPNIADACFYRTEGRLVVV